MKVTIFTIGLLLVLPASFTAQQPVAALKGVPQFTADPKWPMLPDGFTWGQVIGIFADAKGHVWTSSRGRISEWDQQGKQVQSWDARGPDGKWNTIHGLFVDHNGFVWTNARESNLTVKFTRTGQVALVIGKFDQTGGSNDTSLMGRPSEIWVDAADNEVFVADGYGNRRVIVFDGATGKYLRHWGAYGKRPEDPPPQPGGGGNEKRGRAQNQAAVVRLPAQPRVLDDVFRLRPASEDAVGDADQSRAQAPELGERVRKTRVVARRALYSYAGERCCHRFDREPGHSRTLPGDALVRTP